MPDIEVIGVESLQRAGRDPARRGGAGRRRPTAVPRPVTEEVPDLADVRGHNGLIPALEVAAAGGHNLFLQGPPGTGKTMIARRLPSILPPLSAEEAIEVTRIQSVAGLRGGGGLVTERPFRAPHHTISAAGLVGGANPPQPGEATLAHRGVLFLDELSRVRAPEPRGAAPAARGRPRDDRPRAAGHGLPDALHARRRVEPVPVRPRRHALPAAPRRTSPAIAAASRARCWTASTS